MWDRRNMITMNIFDKANKLKDLEKAKKFPLKLDLQFFAEPGEPGDPGNPPNPEPTPEPTKKIELTEEELLKRIESETDKKLDKALKTARAKWEEEFKAKLEEEKKEAERLAKLSEKERKEEELKKREEELNKRLQELERKELKTEAIADLTKKGLPGEFADFVLAESAEKTLENINTFKKAFDEAVAEKVKEALAGKPPKVTMNNKVLTKEQIMAEKDTMKRLKLIQENQHLFN